jgi:hypothetical protein
VTGVHAVIDSGTTTGSGVSSLTVTLTGNAAFSSASSYACTAEDTTHPAALVFVSNQSGSSVTFTIGPGGLAGDTIAYVCTGN